MKYRKYYISHHHGDQLKERTREIITSTSAADAAQMFVQTLYGIKAHLYLPGRWEQPYTDSKDRLWGGWSFGVSEAGQRVYVWEQIGGSEPGPTLATFIKQGFK